MITKLQIIKALLQLEAEEEVFGDQFYINWERANLLNEVNAPTEDELEKYRLLWEGTK